MVHPSAPTPWNIRGSVGFPLDEALELGPYAVFTEYV